VVCIPCAEGVSFLRWTQCNADDPFFGCAPCTPCPAGAPFQSRRCTLAGGDRRCVAERPALLPAWEALSAAARAALLAPPIVVGAALLAARGGGLSAVARRHLCRDVTQRSLLRESLPTDEGEEHDCGGPARMAGAAAPDSEGRVVGRPAGWTAHLSSSIRSLLDFALWSLAMTAIVCVGIAAGGLGAAPRPGAALVLCGEGGEEAALAARLRVAFGVAVSALGVSASVALVETYLLRQGNYSTGTNISSCGALLRRCRGACGVRAFPQRRRVCSPSLMRASFPALLDIIVGTSLAAAMLLVRDCSPADPSAFVAIAGAGMAACGARALLHFPCGRVL
jgi:hypothetical protein